MTDPLFTHLFLSSRIGDKQRRCTLNFKSIPLINHNLKEPEEKNTTKMSYAVEYGNHQQTFKIDSKSQKYIKHLSEESIPVPRVNFSDLT